jgi:hypothetical protein
MQKQRDSNDSYKMKSPKGDGMHWCLPLLKNGRKLVLFSFTNVDPQSSDSTFPSRRHRQP